MDINDLQRSALIESGNIGSGHAAIALSQLMGHKIMIAVPSVNFVDWADLNMIPASAGKSYIQVSLSVYNDVRGAMVFIVEEAMAYKLCDIVMGMGKGSTKYLGEIEQSAIKEIGSILSISYLNAVSELTKLSMIGSIPDFNIGGLEALTTIMKKKEIDIKNVGKVICIKTEFIEASNRIDAYLFFVSTDEYTEKIMRALGV